MASSLHYGQAAPDFPRDLPPARDMRDVFMPVPSSGHSLARLLESEIIPRLVATSIPRERHGDAAIAPNEVEDFVPLALQVEADALLDHAERLLARGVSVTTLLVDLLAPAARRLGEFWVEDRCDFVDVTMALWRLQEVVHEVTARGAPAARAPGAARRALFSSMPGEQHSFGTVVIDEVFCREGWITDRMGETSARELCGRVAGTWFDLIGLTVSCDCHTGALPALIASLRSVSRNPRVRVMLGGRVLVENPGIAATAGADGTAPDAREALILAGSLVDGVESEAVPCG